MPVYSEVLEDHEIVKMIRNKYNNVLVVGCPSCMNESLAYINNSPIFIKEGKKDIPFSINEKVQKIVKTLNSEGISVKFTFIPTESNTFCIIDTDKDNYQLSKDNQPEAIIVLCCPSGVYGLASKYPNIKILKVTRQCGYLSYNCYTDEDGTKHIIKEKSCITSINKKE